MRALPGNAEGGEIIVCRIVWVGLRGAFEDRTGRCCKDGRHRRDIVNRGKWT
jgi:hypothetical protein